jgi:hypothetical protein
MVGSSRAWPIYLCMARRVTPASRRCVAEQWRRVGMPPARFRIPARGWALRKAPWTRRRCMGSVAGGMGFCSRPVAGKSQVGWRGVVQECRQQAQGSGGRGTEQSLAPVPRCTWPMRRWPSMAETGRKSSSCSRSPKLETVGKYTRVCKGVAMLSKRRTSCTRRRAGSRYAAGARMRARSCPARSRTGREKKRRPREQRRMEVGAR